MLPVIGKIFAKVLIDRVVESVEMEVILLVSVLANLAPLESYS